MFKINLHHRFGKFVAISASALMLLSIGGGALGTAHANIHADSIYSLFQKLDSSSQYQVMDAIGNGQITKPEIHQGEREYQSNPVAFNALAKRYNYHVSPQLLEYYINNPAAAQRLLNNSKKGHATKAPSKQTVKKSSKQVTKKSHPQSSKQSLKKHSRKTNRRHACKHTRRTRKSQTNRASLLKQINGLKHQLRRTKDQLNKLNHRKYRTRRAKRYAKRQLAILNREYNAINTKLNRLSKQVKGTKKSNRRHKIVTHHNRKASKRMNK